MKKVFILIFLSGLFLQDAFAQNFYYRSPTKPWAFEMGYGPGWTLSDNSFPSSEQTFRTHWAGSMALTKNFNGKWGLRGTGGLQKFSGTTLADPQTRIRLAEEDQAYEFMGYALYGDLAPVYNYGFRKFYNSRSHFNLYSSAGLGLMGIFSDHHFQVRESRVETEQYTEMVVYIPLRTGANFRFKPLWEVSLEAGFHLTFSDTIDGRTGNGLNDHFLTLQVKVRKLFSFDY